MPPLQAPKRLVAPRGEHRRTSADRIFISYRRADSGGWARSLHDHLEERLGTGRSFRDVATEAGVDFHEHVESLLDRCDVLLAVIGRRWASITDADGRRRLDDPGDLVRREIARALERPDVQVIPVLVDGAKMPAEHDLPPDLAPLTRRHAVELTDARWEYDVDKLTQRLRDLVGEKPHGPWWRAWPVRAGIVVTALVGAALLLWAAFGSHGDQGPTTKAAKLSDPTVDRNISFGQYLDRKGFSTAPYPAARLARRGVFVAFDYRIQGYNGKRLPVQWQLMDARTGDRLGQSSDVAITPDAHAQTDQATWDFWVEVPRGANRRFYVQLQLYDNHGTVPIARLRTATFGPSR